MCSWRRLLRRILKGQKKRVLVVIVSLVLIDFEQREDGVTARVIRHKSDEPSDIEETVQAAWLVGADGARSVVRKQLGLSFLGETEVDHRIIIADVELKGLSDGVRAPSIIEFCSMVLTYNFHTVLASLERRSFWRVCVNNMSRSGYEQ